MRGMVVGEGGRSSGVLLYVTMRITFNIPEFTRNESNSDSHVLKHLNWTKSMLSSINGVEMLPSSFECFP